MITTVVFCFIEWNLKLIFALSLLGQYLGLCSLTILLICPLHRSNVATPSPARWLVIPLHLLFIACLAIGLTDTDMGAKCTVDSNLPIIFYAKDGCFAAYFIFLYALHCKQFCINFGKQ